MKKHKIYSHYFGPFYYKNKKDDPAYQMAMKIKDKLEPGLGGVGPARTLQDMSADEIAAIETQYGCKVKEFEGCI